MRHLAAAEAQGDLHLVAFLEEAVHGLHLHVVVVLVDAGAQLDFLDLDGALLLARLRGLLLLEKAEATIIEDLADRRNGVRGDLDEVEAGILGKLQRIEERDHATVGAGIVDELNLANSADIAVRAGTFLGRGRGSAVGTTNGGILLYLARFAPLLQTHCTKTGDVNA